MVNGMTASRSFSVALLGVRDFDKRLLSGIFKLSVSRSRSYHKTELDLRNPPDIVMLGTDNTSAFKTFKASLLDSTGKPKIPTILLSKNAPKAKHFYHLVVPCRAPHVLRVLDDITIKELNFLPELTIGDENQDQPLSDKVLSQLESKNATDSPDKKVLIVDDSSVVRKQIELQLNMLNVAADTAEDGESALAMIKKHEYTAIFLDVVMPGMDGYKVCKTIKRSPDTRSVPVIMLTGRSSPFDRVKGKLAGCDSYLTKPVEREAFEKTVKPYLLQPMTTVRKTG
jgi:twitching motility two-component system response regulator PilG